MGHAEPEATEPVQDLEQFEPDFDGFGGEVGEGPPGEAADDPQWIVWQDATEESDWVAAELLRTAAGL